MVDPCAFGNPTPAQNSSDLASYGRPDRTTAPGPGHNIVNLSSGFGQITTERFGGDQQDARMIQLPLKYFF